MDKILCFIVVFLLYIVLDGTMMMLFMAKYFGGSFKKYRAVAKWGQE